MMHRHQASSLLSSWPSLARNILAVMFVGILPSISMAEDTVKLTPEQATNLGVRVVRPIASPTDKTLPYPAQIVIPTPQLWVVSSPVAGMVTSLAVARGDRVNTGQPLVMMESPSFVSQQRDYLQAVAQEALSAQQFTRPNFSKATQCRNGCWRRARPKPGRAGQYRGCGAAANASAQRPLG